jgi:hypothetical protein
MNIQQVCKTHLEKIAIIGIKIFQDKCFFKT